MRPLAALLAAVALLGVTAASASAADRYLAPTGVNNGSCTVQANPCSSFSYVQSVATSGDTVNLAAGDYTPDVNFLNTPNLTYKGPQAGVSAIGRTGPEARVLVTSGGFGFIIQADNIVMDGLTFTSLSAAGDGSFGLYNLNPATVRNVNFTNILTGLYAGSSIVASGLNFDTKNDAMYATGVSTQVSDSRFAPASAYAGLISAGNGPTTMTGNSFVSGTYGFLTYAGVSTVTATGNAFSPSIPNGFYNDGSPADARNNWWGCNTGPNTAGCATVTGPGVVQTTTAPRLVLSASVNPDPVLKTASTAVTADLKHNSDGDPVTVTPVAKTVTFSSDNGTYASPTATLQDGVATRTLGDFTIIGPSTASVAVDNQVANKAFSTYLPIPVSTVAPAIEDGGAPLVGVQLTGTNGTWNPAANTGYAYEWKRCDTGGDDCSTVATRNRFYTPTADDIGHTLRLQIIASNVYGPSLPATSAPTGVVQGVAPANTSLPTIDDAAAPKILTQLTGQWGTWSPAATAGYTYEWLRCDTGGDDCSVVSTRNRYYTPVADDVGHTLRMRVTASNAFGAGTPATSVPTGVVEGIVPANTVAPVLTDASAPVLGTLITGTTGSWSPAATSYAYTWLRCDAGGDNCTSVATGKRTYTPVVADVGSTLRLRVVATNAYGASTPATTAASGVVDGVVPAVTTAPVLTDGASPVIGTTVTGTTGSWNPSATAGYAYTWLRCDTSGDNCTSIATGKRTYVPVADDVGSTLRLRVVAANAYGASAPATTAPSGVVNGVVPAETTQPGIDGGTTPTVGVQLVGQTGTWIPYPTLGYTYQWQRCDTSGDNCTVVSTRNRYYTPVLADVGSTLRLRVVGSNAYGAGTPALTAPTGVVSSGV